MLVGRFVLMIGVLAIAGSLVRKQKRPDVGGHVPDQHAVVHRVLVSVVVIVVGGSRTSPSSRSAPSSSN